MARVGTSLGALVRVTGTQRGCALDCSPRNLEIDVIALGHIAYANCFPVHGPILLGDVPFDGEIVRGEPARLNRLLAAARVQVAPCSSIEYARNAGRYRVVPGLAIASRGDVRSILLASRVPPAELGTCRVALPTASASSSVLAEILLRERWSAQPETTAFDQAVDDPLATFDAALFIGDVALKRRRESPPGVHWTDLGGAWTDWTGLPFVYALWQVHAAPALDEAVAAAAAILLRARLAGLADLDALAQRYPDEFPPGRDALPGYWRSLSYTLDDESRRGLRAFFELAVRIGAAREAPPLRYLKLSASPARA